jgi:hypothetical protein
MYYVVDTNDIWFIVDFRAGRPFGTIFAFGASRCVENAAQRSARAREKPGGTRTNSPGAVIIDSQSVKMSPKGGKCGYNGGKERPGVGTIGSRRNEGRISLYYAGLGRSGMYRNGKVMD